MVKILSVENIRAADKYTIENEPISSYDLMERAANRAFQWIEQHLLASSKKHFSIFCGIGNNGGDGLVIARKLMEADQEVTVYLVELSKNYSSDFQQNLDRLKLTPTVLNKGNFQFELSQSTIVIDAIFGTGLNRKVEGFAVEVIDQINRQSDQTISIDIPSGLFADDNSNNEAHLIIQAAYTLTFQFPKLAFLFPQNEVFVGQWVLIDIGLHPEFIEEVECTNWLVTLEDAKYILKSRKSFSHKGDYGRAFLMVGSKGKMGAAVLAAKSCLRSGVGLLTVQVPACGYTVLQSTVPEAMVEQDEQELFLTELKTEVSFDVIGIGPGIGFAEETQKLFKLLIQQSKVPLVIDADAITILAENKTWLSFLPSGSVLTPHPGEFKRLVGKWDHDDHRHQLLIDFCKKYQLTVILKGRHTAIATPDGRVYFNSTGNPGMASGGSGDVLTGIITALIAQGYHAEQASILGVYIHGLSGDLAVIEKSQEAMIASDLIEFLPNAFLKLTDKPK